IVLCTNTMHKIAHIIESRCSLPFLHIADATGRAIARQGLHRVVVVVDVLASAFDSAGQRCSALRVLCLQDDIAEHTLKMLRGAMA
ncbi:hypothetical protein MJM83_29190, partial [Salmonella enterica subsp. enterica serovar Montevideo]|nr:hypothetical protein [Salmonella enterica subsp. enterica serovar Montevideo]